MESIRIEGTDDIPEVILDKENSIFKISGKSLPENVNEFFLPIVSWIKDYAKNPNQHTTIEFRMEYFNTASSKKLLDILEEFEIIYIDGHDVKINWYFLEDDDDMQKAGESFFKLVEIPHEIFSFS